MSTVAVKWSNVELHGFWFVTNFLREEGLDDFGVKVVMDDLNMQYEKYRKSLTNRNDFGPDFKFDTEYKSYIGRIQMFDPITKQCFGESHVCIEDDRSVSILPF